MRLHLRALVSRWANRTLTTLQPFNIVYVHTVEFCHIVVGRSVSLRCYNGCESERPYHSMGVHGPVSRALLTPPAIKAVAVIFIFDLLVSPRSATKGGCNALDNPIERTPALSPTGHLTAGRPCPFGREIHGRREIVINYVVSSGSPCSCADVPYFSRSCRLVLLFLANVFTCTTANISRSALIIRSNVLLVLFEQGATVQEQQDMVVRVLSTIAGPVVPLVYKLFMAPWPWAPFLTAFFTPPFFKV